MIGIVEHPPDITGLVAFAVLLVMICLIWRAP